MCIKGSYEVERWSGGEYRNARNQNHYFVTYVTIYLSYFSNFAGEN